MQKRFKRVLKVTVIFVVLALTSMAYFAYANTYDMRSFVCYNPSGSVCYFNSTFDQYSNPTPLPSGSTWTVYSGSYPNTTTTLIPTTSTAGNSGWLATTYTYPFWFDVYANSTHFYYASDGTQSLSGIIDTSTRLISTTIDIASTTIVTINYNVNSSDLASTTAQGGILRLHSFVRGLDTGWSSTSTDITLTSSGAGIQSYGVTLPHAGLYHLYSSIYALDNYGIIGQVYTSTTTDFTFVSDFYSSRFGTTTPLDQGIPYAECSFTQIFGCMQNAGMYLFYPASDSIGTEMLNEFRDTLYKKPPIGYFVMIKEAMNQINASSTGAIVGWTIPQGFRDNFFTPVSIAVTSILGFFILIEFYKRFKDVDLKG